MTAAREQPEQTSRDDYSDSYNNPMGGESLGSYKLEVDLIWEVIHHFRKIYHGQMISRGSLGEAVVLVDKTVSNPKVQLRLSEFRVHLPRLADERASVHFFRTILATA